jgi:hypothetical protein
MGGIEQQYICAVQRIFNGLPLYTDPANFPFFTYQHPPFFTWLLSAVCTILQIDPVSHPHQVYITGRTISLLSNVSGAFIIYLILTHLHVKKFIAFFIGALSVFYLTRHNFSARPDSLKSLLILIYFYLFLKNSGQRTYLLYILAALIPFVKQDGVIIIAGTLGYYFVTGNHKEIKKLMLAASITGFIMLLLLTFLFKLNFIKNIIGTNLEFINLKPLLYITFEFIKKDFYLLAVWAWFTARNLTTIKTERALLFIWTQSLFLLVFDILATLKFGSDVVYFADLQNLLLIIAGLAIHQLYSKIDAVRNMRVLILALIMLLSFTQYRRLVYENSPLLNSEEAEKNFKTQYFSIAGFSSAIKKNMKPGEIVFPLYINFVPFFGDKKCMYGYYYVYHQFLYLSDPDYPIKYVVQNYGSSDNFHKMFNQKKVDYIILPNNSNGAYIYTNYYTGFQPFLSNSEFICYKIRK